MGDGAQEREWPCKKKSCVHLLLRVEKGQFFDKRRSWVPSQNRSQLQVKILNTYIVFGLQLVLKYSLLQDTQCSQSMVHDDGS